MCYSWEYLSSGMLEFSVMYLQMLCGTQWTATSDVENESLVLDVTEIENPDCADTGCECPYNFDFEIPYSPESLGQVSLTIRLNSCGETYNELQFTIDLAEQSSGTTCE
jgi:hypothetical protein